MRILVLTDNFPPYSRGGAEVACERLVLGYLKKGYEVRILTTVQEKSLEGKENREELKIDKIYATYHERWRAYLSLYNPKLIKRLKNIINDYKPDIIHAHNIHKYFSYASLKMIRDLDILFILTVHDCMPICYKKFTCFIDKNDLSVRPKMNYRIRPWRCCIWEQRLRYFPLRNFFIRYFLNNYVKRLVVVSNELKILLNTNGIRCNDFIHHGIDLKNFQVNSEKAELFKRKYKLFGKKIIFFGGRLNGAKGIEQLLESFKLLAEKDKDVVLMIAGKKDISTVNWPFKERIIITGWLEHNDLLCAYACSNVVVYPSVCFDTFGLINLEAMAMKKPMITTCFGGSKEIVVDGETGYIVNPLNTEKMAEKIEELLNNPEKAKQMGEMGHKRVVANFTLEKETGKYLKIFNDLCQK